MRQTAARKLPQQVRRGHGHASDAHGHHAPAEPYAVKHHDRYPHEAYAFGRKPGDPQEGWEVMTYVVYALCTGILVLGMNVKENDDFKVRACGSAGSPTRSRCVAC